ncbi:hypothetical protein [Nostoc sp.]
MEERSYSYILKISSKAIALGKLPKAIASPQTISVTSAPTEY